MRRTKGVAGVKKGVPCFVRTPHAADRAHLPIIALPAAGRQRTTIAAAVPASTRSDRSLALASAYASWGALRPPPRPAALDLAAAGMSNRIRGQRGRKEKSHGRWRNCRELPATLQELTTIIHLPFLLTVFLHDKLHGLLAGREGNTAHISVRQYQDRNNGPLLVTLGSLGVARLLPAAWPRNQRTWKQSPQREPRADHCLPHDAHAYPTLWLERGGAAMSARTVVHSKSASNAEKRCSTRDRFR